MVTFSATLSSACQSLPPLRHLLTSSSFFDEFNGSEIEEHGKSFSRVLRENVFSPSLLAGSLCGGYFGEYLDRRSFRSSDQNFTMSLELQDMDTNIFLNDDENTFF